MLKKIIGKLEKKKKKKKRQTWKASTFCFVLFRFVCKAELKRLWVGLDSGTK